jgi:hypothetical protein
LPFDLSGKQEEIIMHKTPLRAVVLIALMLAWVPAWGVVEREVFEVHVSIPTASFYVVPVDPQLVQREQRLPFNTVTSQLGALRAPFDVKNTTGSIGARLGEEAYLSNGLDRIDLRVKFNNVELGLDTTHVVSAAEARPGQRVHLEIAAIRPADGYSSGEYFGTVHMVFDATAP